MAALTAILSPKYYHAQIVIVDEQRETDLLIGLSEWASIIRQNAAFAEESGISDPLVYASIISSREFARQVSNIYLEPRHETLFSYIQQRQASRPAWLSAARLFSARDARHAQESVIDEIQDNIKYNIRARYYKITIQYSDQDATVAALVADSIGRLLQQSITEKKRAKSLQLQRDMAAYRTLCGQKYHKAQEQYAVFIETHQDISDAKTQTQADFLRKDRDDAFSLYNDACLQAQRATYLTQKHSMSFATLTAPSVPLHASNTHPAVWFFVYLSIGFLLLTWYILYRRARICGRFSFGDIFSPWCITFSVWGIILLALQFESKLLYPLSAQFYHCVLLWLPIFCAASLITFNVLPAVQDEHAACTRPKDINRFIFDALFVLSLVITPIYVYKIFNIVMMFDTTDLLNNLRVYAVYRDDNFGFLHYSYIINQALFVVAIWQYPRIPLWKIILITIVCLMGQVAIMEKNGILLLVLTLLFVLYEKRVVTFRSILSTLAIIIVVFFFFNFFKEIKSDEDFESMTFIDFIGIYILSPPVAFGYVTQDLSSQFGSHCFEYFYQVFNSLGWGKFQVNERLQDFVFVPLPTNVYTIFQPIFEDFGYAGIAFFALAYGVFFGHAYRVFRNGSFIARCVYIYLAKVLIMQFYHEDFLMSIAMFIQFVILIVIISQQWIVFPLRTGTQAAPNIDKLKN